MCLATVIAGARDGCPLLVVHGGPDWDHSYLRRPLIDLSSSRRVIWFDLRGCGASSRSLGPSAYQPEFVLEDIVRLLDALDVERADVLGFSYGGQLAQSLVARQPGRVRDLVLASTTAYGTSSETSMAHSDTARVEPDLVKRILTDASLSALERRAPSQNALHPWISGTSNASTRTSTSCA